MFYVMVTPINGRREFYNLVDDLTVLGYADNVEYSNGGWQTCDEKVFAAPHLKFKFEDDAIAYCFRYGCEYSKSIPIV